MLHAWMKYSSVWSMSIYDVVTAMKHSRTMLRTTFRAWATIPSDGYIMMQTTMYSHRTDRKQPMNPSA